MPVSSHLLQHHVCRTVLTVGCCCSNIAQQCNVLVLLQHQRPAGQPAGAGATPSQELVIAQATIASLHKGNQAA